MATALLAGAAAAPDRAAAQIVQPIAQPAVQQTFQPTVQPVAQPAAVPAPVAPNVAAALNGMVDQQKMLVELLAQKGVLTASQAAAMVRQAQHTVDLVTGPTIPGSTRPGSTAVRSAAAEASAAGAPVPVVLPSGETHVPYIPENVKRQIKDQVKKEMLQQAQSQGWGEPNQLPDWLHRFTFFGDARLRYEGQYFNKGNDPLLTDFQALNSGPAYDVSSNNSLNPPFINDTRNRDRERLRGRLGVLAQVSDTVTSEIRLTSGNLTEPVTQNQTLGNSFNKDSFVLDRFDIRVAPTPWFNIVGGRIPNPWIFTDLVWANDLDFDGFAAHAEQPVPGAEDVVGFVTAGGFPLENTTLNLAVNADTSNKRSSSDKWLVGAQGGLRWKIDDNYNLRFAAAYYDFLNYEGKTSNPCTVLAQSDPCSSDISRPGFTQKGNTFFALRNLTTVPGNPNPPQFQYFGLASPFRELDLYARFDARVDGPIHALLDADYVTNLAFDGNAVQQKSVVNNQLPGKDGKPPPTDAQGRALLDSGSNAYFVRLQIGHPEIHEFLDWNVYGGYKYIEADALVAAFNDTDFHLGGTNAKGYVLGANFGLTHNTWFNFRWFSADEISGEAPVSIDVLQADLNATF